MRFSREYEIGCHDVDLNNNIKPSLIQRYMMDTADHQMRERRPSGEDLLEIKKAFIMTRIYIEITGQLHTYDRIKADTWSCPTKGATFNRCFELHRDGVSMAKAHSMWALIDTETGKVCRPKEVDISAYEHEEALEMDMPAKFKMPKDIEFHMVGTKKVLYSETDQNRHLNNTYYGDILWSYIPDICDKELTSVLIQYHHEAPLNGVMDIHMGKMDDNHYCFKTFVEGSLNVEAVFGIR